MLLRVFIHKAGAFLGDLDLAAAHAVGDDVLGCGGAVLHVCDLGLGLGTAFTDSLDRCDYFLLVLALRSGCFFCFLAGFGFVDLEFENSII